MYAICDTEDSNDTKAIYISEYENEPLENKIIENLETYYVRENEDEEDIKPNYSETSRFHCIAIMKDCSTQTDNNYFLKNFKLLLDKNERLENEVVRWDSRYNQLLSHMKILETKIQRLTLNSSETRKS